MEDATLWSRTGVAWPQKRPVSDTWPSPAARCPPPFVVARALFFFFFFSFSSLFSIFSCGLRPGSRACGRVWGLGPGLGSLEGPGREGQGTPGLTKMECEPRASDRDQLEQYLF